MHHTRGGIRTIFSQLPHNHKNLTKPKNFLTIKNTNSHTQNFPKNSQSHQTNSQTQSQNNYTHKNQHESKPETENNSEIRSKSEKVEAFFVFSLRKLKVRSKDLWLLFSKTKLIFEI
jgi:hypothetical protein